MKKKKHVSGNKYQKGRKKSDKQAYKITKEQILLSFAACLLPIISYCILGPLEVFSGNRKDFGFNCTDFFPQLCVWALIVWLGVSCLLAILPPKANRSGGILVISFGVASYIQNMFMNTKLSEDDGAPMRWNEMGAYPTINLMLWLIIFAVIIYVAVSKKRIWKDVALGSVGFLCAVQLAAVFSLLFSGAADVQGSPNLYVEGEDQFKIAPNDNIIVLVLDTFGMARFEEVLQIYPETGEDLKDFVCYNNTDCHYYCTFPSITHMLTGMDFDFHADTSQAWLKTAWESERAERFFAAVRAEKYRFNLYSASIGYIYGDCDNLYGKIDNVQEKKKQVDKKTLIPLMLKISAYKYLPYRLKPRFEVMTSEFEKVVTPVDGQAVIENNGKFYQTLLRERLSLQGDMDNAVIVQHLSGLHAPYTIDEEAHPVKEALPEQTAKGLMCIVKEYLQQLKELGKYDDSTIIIMADHGAWHGGDTQPLFLIKEKNEVHEEMRVKTAPISLDDFQATILSLLGREYEGFGTSIYDWEDDDIRERKVYMRFTDEGYPDVQGSSFNVYYGYTYTTDREELNQKVNAGDFEVLPATRW